MHNFDTAAAKFGIEISAEKTKIMTTNGTLQRYITIQGQKLETVDHFKYLGAVMRVLEEKCSPAQTMVALARLKTIWKEKSNIIKHTT